MENRKPVSSSLTFTPLKLNFEKDCFWPLAIYDNEGWIPQDVAAVSNTPKTPNADGFCTNYIYI